MSGESVAGIGIGVIGGVVVLGGAAAAGCAFVVGRGTSVALGAGVAALGRHLERRQEERDEAHAERRQWQDVLRDVATRNARVGALQAVLETLEDPASETRPELVLPAPLVLGRQSHEELQSWCAQTDGALTRIEAGVIERSTEALLRRAWGGRTREALTGADAVLQDGPVLAGSGSGGSWDREAMLADLSRVVQRLAVNVGPDDRDSVTMAAKRVLNASSRTEARNRLDDVRVRIDAANVAATGRQAQAVQAAALLQPLTRADAAAEPLRQALREVVAGRRELSDDVVDQARLLTLSIQEEADRVYLRQSMTEALGELGYDVEEGFQTAVPVNGVLQVRRSEWTAHGVRMVLDEQKKELRAVVVRTESDGSWDEGRVDTEREQQWCTALEELQDSLASKGITLDVRSTSKPGTRKTPLLRPAPTAGPARPVEIARHLGNGS